MNTSLLSDRVRDRLVREGHALTPESVAAAVSHLGEVVAHSAILEVWEQLRREVVGAGVLEPLLREPGVTDVLVNGPDQVYVDRGQGLERRDVRFADDAEVRRLATRLAAGAGRRLDDAAPYVDARLTDGTRFHAGLSPISRPGTTMSLRVPPRRSFSIAELTAAGTISDLGAELLTAMVTSQAAFLISGGTGSGKTTLMAALLGLVPATERIVIVEDSTELRPTHPHVVGLEARPPNQEGKGALELHTLVKQALRMRPDRIVVGEVRGAEVVDLLAALNTGHAGGCGTLHANSAIDVPARIEALALAAGLPREAAHAQFCSALQVVVHIDRAAGRRQVRELGVPVSGSDHVARIVSAVRFDHDLTPRWGPGRDALAALLS